MECLGKVPTCGSTCCMPLYLLLREERVIVCMHFCLRLTEKGKQRLFFRIPFFLFSG